MINTEIDLKDYFHDISTALGHYRGLASFCESAVDAMDWYMDEFTISSQIRAVTIARTDTFTIKAHMDKMLEQYRKICEFRNEHRKYNIIRYKYLEMPGKGENKLLPFSNDQLADVFDCSVQTIQREIKCAKAELKIYFFGVDRINLSE